ncbi:MAG: TolC family protein [Candidatus Xenobia bacterium]
MSSIPISTLNSAEKAAQQGILAASQAVDQRNQALQGLEAEATAGAVTDDQVSLGRVAVLDARDGVVSATSLRNRLDAQLFAAEGQSTKPALKEEVDNQANHVRIETDRVGEAEQQLQIVQNRLGAGTATATDVSAAQATVSGATSLLHQAEAEYLLAQGNLQQSR